MGVIGVGHLGRHHARLYHKMGLLAAISDVDGEQAKKISAEYDVPAFSDYRELLDRVDAVSVAVPTVLHHRIAKEFLGRGIPALVEKPLAKTIEEGEDLVRIAREQKTILAVGHVERFNPAVQSVIEMIKKPRFIEVHRLSPFRFRSSDIDVVMDLMIHDIDIVMHLVSTPLRKVDAVGIPLLFGKEDISNARLEFEDGCVVNLTASRISEKAMRKIRIFQEDCYVTMDTLQKEAWVYRTTPELAGALEKLPKDRDLSLEDIASIPKEFYSVKKMDLGEEEPLGAELQSFVDSVRNGTTPVVPGEHGVRAMKAAAKILSEMRNHEWH